MTDVVTHLAPEPALHARDSLLDAFASIAARPLSGRARRPMSSSPPRSESDARLVRAALQGRSGAAALLIERLCCVPAMVRSKHARLGMPLDVHAVDDVVQNAMAAIWSKLESFEGRSSLETWIWGFCVNELYKGIHRQRRERGRTVDWVEEPAHEDPEPAASYSQLHEGLHRLGGSCERVIRLKHFEDLTFEQIAQRLSISANTAKTHYYRGLQRLKPWVAPLWGREAP